MGILHDLGSETDAQQAPTIRPALALTLTLDASAALAEGETMTGPDQAAMAGAMCGTTAAAGTTFAAMAALTRTRVAVVLMTIILESQSAIDMAEIELAEG